MEGMGYNLDPNALVNALGRDNDDGMFGGNGLLWIFLLILFGGGAGFGVNRAEALGCTDQLVLNAINGNKEAVNSLGSYLGTEVNQVQAAITSLGNGICELGYKSGQDTASIISNITSGNAAISRQVADCCCATQRGIDQVRYDMQTGFNAVNVNLDKCCCNMEKFVDSKIDAAQAENRAGFQAIRDYMVNEKIAGLQQDLQTAQFTLSQNAQTAKIEEYVKSLLTVTCPKA